MTSSKPTIIVTLRQLAKTIDHSLLHPTLTDADVRSGLATCLEYQVGTACVRPCDVAVASRTLEGSGVRVCAVVGFPHGSSKTEVKVHEARVALSDGAHEIDVVVNIGKVLSGEWAYVTEELRAVSNAVIAGGAILKVIFENDFLSEEHIARLCQICSELGIAFVKTSTGYGFVKHENGFCSYKGATVEHIKLMRATCGPAVQIKAAGGVRTLDDLLLMMSLGVTRIGATATVAILEEAKKRGMVTSPWKLLLMTRRRASLLAPTESSAAILPFTHLEELYSVVG